MIEQISGPAAVALVFILLYKAGILGAMVSWITKTPHNQRIVELEAFKVEAESNHWHDIDDLKADNKEVWKAIQMTQRDIAKIQADVANINGRLQNGHNRN